MKTELARLKLQQHVGARIAKAWKGFGSALFLDLEEGDRPNTIFFEFCWRCERGSVVERGWNDALPVIAEFCETLHGLTITSITIADGVPDLIVGLSDGRVIRTIVEVQPDWHVRLRPSYYVGLDETWIVRDTHEEETAGSSFHDDLMEEESELSAAADKRWRPRTVENSLHPCRTCYFYRRINGNFSLLDWGVCICPESRFDGTVVNTSHSCEEHEEE